VDWFGPGGNYISNQVSTPLAAGASGWTELGVDAVAPAGAAYAMVYSQSTGGTGKVWLDDATATVITASSFPALPGRPEDIGTGLEPR
jgi:hypothetical protein